MKEFGYTYEEITNMTPYQYNYLLIGLEIYYKEQERQAKKIASKARRGRRR